jgi:lipopolysaccharide export system permease protein
MRLIDRYLLREFLFWLAVFFSGFLIIWIAFDLGLDIHRFQEAHMRGKDIIEYYFFAIPEFVPIALPVAILLATLYVVTNHSRYNEITAIRAVGISLLRLCLPYFAAGLFFSALLFAFNEYFAPQAGDMADEILVRRVPSAAKAQHYLTRNFAFVNYGEGDKTHKWTASIYNSQTHEMTTPLISWPSSNGMDISISATTAKWTNNVWVLTGNVTKTLGATTRLLVTNSLALPEITETPSEIQSDIKVNKYHSISSKTRRADVPLADIVNYLRFHPHPDRKMRNWLFTKLHGRFAGPFACLVVVIVAIPFSARSGRRNIFVGVAASIFIFFVYFVLQQVGLTFGETGWVPPWLGAWLPNLFFGVGGLYLMSRVR